ncbi:MAG: MBL fold metallo-hydrolase [Anaerolineae bacterium]|nr:MBL fold metallo-hydrolase [Phycisphaerae bacterium]
MPADSPADSFVVVKFWGIRGSIPTPGPLTRGYGGNTSCYELRFGDAIFICDAGSGIRELGNDLVARGNSSGSGDTPLLAHLLLSHTHWDHVQGFPFFAPAYQANNRIIVYDKSPYEAKSFRMLSGQMTGDYFPVKFSELKANITWDHLADGDREIAGVRIRTFDQVHTGGSLGFSFHYHGLKIVYATDNEIDQLIVGGDRSSAPRIIARPQVDFVRGADLLIADGQYTDDEYAAHVGWGHPSIFTLVDLAAQADVKCLAVTHHDPNRSDEQVDALIEQARLRAKSLGSDLEVYAAREGVELKLTPR